MLNATSHQENENWGVPIVAKQYEPYKYPKDAFSIPGLSQWVKDPELL